MQNMTLTQLYISGMSFEWIYIYMDLCIRIPAEFYGCLHLSNLETGEYLESTAGYRQIIKYLKQNKRIAELFKNIKE